MQALSNSGHYAKTKDDLQTMGRRIIVCVFVNGKLSLAGKG